MAIDIQWDNEEKTIVRQTYGEVVTPEEYYQMVKQSAELLNSVNHPVDLIVDLRKLKFTLRGMTTMTQYANKMVPANQRIVVAVGLPATIKQIINLLMRIAPRAAKNTYYVDTIEEAYRILEEQRAKLTV